VAAGGAPAQEAIFAFWGINVPGKWTEPGGLTPDAILAEKNADARAMGVRAYGVEKFVEVTTDKVLDIDQGTTLTRALIQTKDGSRWMVATDGSTKRVYTLAVPAATKNCVEAYKALTNNRLDDNDKVAEG
jgi:hypothetical protein